MLQQQHQTSTFSSSPLPWPLKCKFIHVGFFLLIATNMWCLSSQLQLRLTPTLCTSQTSTFTLHLLSSESRHSSLSRHRTKITMSASGRCNECSCEGRSIFHQLPTTSVARDAALRLCRKLQVERHVRYHEPYVAAR